MEKEALIDIILNDIKEVETLVRSFKGKSSIAPAFLNLTKTKLKNISEELNLLEQFESTTPVAETSESSLTSSSGTKKTDSDGAQIAESSNRFAREEATQEPEMITIVEKTVTKEVVEPQVTEAVEKIPEAPTMSTGSQPVNIESQPEIQQTETPEPPQQTKVHQPERKNKEHSILGEQIGKDKTSVYERVATQKEQAESIKQLGKPVDDIRKAFGLNDRFYYQRELFNGNPELFNQTLDQINQMESYDSATHFLLSNFQWTEDNEVAEAFLKSVKRRFI